MLATEVLSPSDHRAHAALFDQAKAKEVAGLLNRGAFEVVYKTDLLPMAKNMGSRFVLAIKNQVTNDETFRARFVVHCTKNRALNFSFFVT